MLAKPCGPTFIKWDQEPLTRWPQRWAWGKQRGIHHEKDCVCKKCQDLRALAKEDLVKRIPILKERMGERPAWNIATWPFEDIWKCFAAVRSRYISAVEFGKITHGL